MDNVKKVNDIMRRLFNVVLKIEERALKESSLNNLSITEMHTLTAIGIGKERTMTEVSEALRINLSTLTTAISKLVKKGYVERFRIQRDRRIVKIKLTESGVTAVEENETFHNDLVKKAISKLPEDEIINFIDSFENINQFLGMQFTKPLRENEPLSLRNLKIGKHIVPKGIFQGGMGVGISMSSLATAVCKEGGVGVIAAAEIGFNEEDYEKNSLAANKRVLDREIKKAKKALENMQSRGPLGVNIPYSTKNYKEYIEVAIKAGIEIIISGAGLPMTLPDLCKDENIALIPSVSSPRAARIIMKNWKKKHNRVPDAFIFENIFAGGQLGYKESKIDKEKSNYYQTIVNMKEEIGDIPLIVGGGIIKKSDMEHAYMYGADGIQLGSRFVTTKECDANENIKKAYLSCKENDVTIMKNSSGTIYRVCNNSSNNVLEEDYDVTKALVETAKGNVKNGILFCGGKTYKLDKIEKVADIFKEFDL